MISSPEHHTTTNFTYPQHRPHIIYVVYNYLHIIMLIIVNFIILCYNLNVIIKMGGVFMSHTVIYTFLLLYSISSLGVYVHELGHCFALWLSKHILKSGQKLNIKVIICGLYGRTLSDFYYNFNDLSETDKVKIRLVRLNAFMGVLFEFIFYVLIAIYLLRTYPINTLMTKSAILMITLLFAFLVYTICFGSDSKYLFNPTSFNYNEIVSKNSITNIAKLFALIIVSIIFGLITLKFSDQINFTWTLVGSIFIVAIYMIIRGWADLIKN